MSLFESLQNSAFTDWLLGSESIWRYPFVLTLHTVGLAVVVGISVVVNLRALGVGASIPAERFAILFRYMWIGFALNLATGLILFVTQAADRATDPIFFAKLASIAVALAIGQVIRRRVIDAPPGSRDRRVPWLASSALALWTVSIVTGRLIAYFGG